MQFQKVQPSVQAAESKLSALENHYGPLPANYTLTPNTVSALRAAATTFYGANLATIKQQKGNPLLPCSSQWHACSEVILCTVTSQSAQVYCCCVHCSTVTANHYARLLIAAQLAPSVADDATCTAQLCFEHKLLSNSSCLQAIRQRLLTSCLDQLTSLKATSCQQPITCPQLLPLLACQHHSNNKPIHKP